MKMEIVIQGMVASAIQKSFEMTCPFAVEEFITETEKDIRFLTNDEKLIKLAVEHLSEGKEKVFEFQERLQNLNIGFSSTL